MSRSRPKAASFSSLLLIIVMKGEVTFVVQFGVGPLFEAIAEDDDAAAGRDLEVEFDMPMSEDIVVAVVAYFLLLFGEEDEFFFVLPFVGAGVGYLVEPALFRPVISEFVTPCRREQAEEELRGGRVEEFLETDEGLDLFLNLSGVECLPVRRQHSVAVAEVEGLAIAADGTGLKMNLHARHFGQSAEGPEVVVPDEVMDVDAAADEAADLFHERMELAFFRIVDVVFKPEIEHVAEHVDGHGIFAHHLEHVDEFFLVRPAAFDRQTT